MNLITLVNFWNNSYKNPVLKNQIEIELQKRILSNNLFYCEYFLDICKIRGHSITVSFIPTSNAFKSYGTNVSIDAIFSQEEINELLKNHISIPPVKTFGKIRAKILKKDNLSIEQINTAAKEGFDTRDVYETMHV